MFVRFKSKPTIEVRKPVDYDICPVCQGSNVFEDDVDGERTCHDCATVLETSLITSCLPRSFADEFGVTKSSTGYGDFQLIEAFNLPATNMPSKTKHIEVPTSRVVQADRQECPKLEQCVPTSCSTKNDSTPTLTQKTKTKLLVTFSRVRDSCARLKLPESTTSFATSIVESTFNYTVHITKAKGKLEAYTGAVILVACDSTNNSRTIKDIASATNSDASEVSRMKKKLIEINPNIGHRTIPSQNAYLSIDVMNLFDWCHEALSIRLCGMVDEIKSQPHIPGANRNGQSIMSVLLYWGEVVKNPSKKITRESFLRMTGFCGKTFDRVHAELLPQAAYITQKCFGCAITLPQ